MKYYIGTLLRRQSAEDVATDNSEYFGQVSHTWCPAIIALEEYVSSGAYVEVTIEEVIESGFLGDLAYRLAVLQGIL